MLILVFSKIQQQKFTELLSNNIFLSSKLGYATSLIFMKTKNRESERGNITRNKVTE